MARKAPGPAGEEEPRPEKREEIQGLVEHLAGADAGAGLRHTPLTREQAFQVVMRQLDARRLFLWLVFGVVLVTTAVCFGLCWLFLYYGRGDLVDSLIKILAGAL